MYKLASQGSVPLEQSPRAASLVLLCTLIAGLGATALLFRNAVTDDDARLHERMERATQALVTGASQPGLLDAIILEVVSKLSAIQAEAGGRRITEQLLQSHLWDQPPPGLEGTNFEYLPRVTAGEAEHFPVLIEASKSEYHGSIGVDHSGDLLHRRAMTQSRDTGLMASVATFPNKDSSEPLLTYYYYPLYDSAQPPSTVEERRRLHNGFVRSVTRVPGELTPSFVPESYLGIEATFYPQGEASTFEDVNREFQSAVGQNEVISASYQVKGVPFHMTTRASAQLRRDMVSNNRWWVLSVGLMLTAWMSSIVLWYSQRSRKIMQVVHERTHDLAQQTRKLSELNTALSESEARYRMLANNISDVIFTHDMQGNCTYISPSITRQNGFSEADYLGRPIYQHLTDDSAGLIKQRIETAVRTYQESGIVKVSEAPVGIETKCKDGSVKPMEILVSPIFNDERQVIGFMGVMRDITLRKKAEQEKELLQTAYRQAQKMEAVGTLAGGIAHDFNNLLTGVIGHADLLKLEFGDHPYALKSLDIIEMAAMRARDLTSQLLGFARKGQFQAVPVEINKMLAEVISLIERTVDKNIVISRIDSKLNPVVVGDPGQISQIFLNLAVNARDAMPDGGRLSFETSLEVLDEEFCRTHFDTVPGKYCIITVADTGTGIAPDKIEHIFEPFFTDKTDGKGTGLGLAMVYGVTKSHKGAVTVYSEVGKGSIFKVYLPAGEGSDLAGARQKPRSLIQGTGRVLLVDDQEIVRQIGGKMLGQLGYKVMYAEDGEKGIEIYREDADSIDLVIIDMIMPNMGGLECLEGLRNINPNVKAILASGFSKDSIAEKVNEEHIMGFLQKPFRLQELSELVASIHH